MDNKKKERNRVDKYRSKYKKKRRGFHGYKAEKVLNLNRCTCKMARNLSLSSVGKTKKEVVVEDKENLKTINKIVPIAVNSNSSQGPSISGVVLCKMKRQCFKKYHDKFVSTRL